MSWWKIRWKILLHIVLLFYHFDQCGKYRFDLSCLFVPEEWTLTLLLEAVWYFLLAWGFVFHLFRNKTCVQYKIVMMIIDKNINNIEYLKIKIIYVLVRLKITINWRFSLFIHYFHRLNFENNFFQSFSFYKVVRLNFALIFWFYRRCTQQQV